MVSLTTLSANGFGQQMTAPSAQVTVPLIDQPLRLSDFAGMKPREELRSKLAHVSGFIQYMPNDGQAASEDTEVWMAYTHSTLYFVFLCHDSHPELIRHHLARREDILTDDSVLVYLDTFQDRRTGVLFRVNPQGVQADASWSESSGNDYSFDAVWESDGQVTPQGWMAMIAIPFRSLRFHAGSSDWGIVFKRVFPRNSESSMWPRVAANVSGILSQEAILHGIEGVTGSHNLQVNPYTLAQNVRKLDDRDMSNPFFSARKLEGTAGGEVKLVLKDRIVVDGTVNPDFSDVESDQPQFTVDQRYPVYYSELRPFFLENAGFFNTPITLVYTRNISNPEFGARVTGKIDKTNLGLFLTDDRLPGQTVSSDDPLYHKRALFSAGRVSQDIGKGSSVGLIFADEEFGKGWNRVGGADLVWRIDDHWTTYGQMVESSTMGTEDEGTPPPYSAGPASMVQVMRSGLSFTLNEVYQDFSTGYQSWLGYYQSANFRNNDSYVSYIWYPRHSRLQNFGLESEQNFAFDHKNNRVFRYLSMDPFWGLPRNFIIAPLLVANSDTLTPDYYPALTTVRNFAENKYGIVLKGAPWTQFNFSLKAMNGANVNYYPLSGQAPILMRQQTVKFLFTVKPVKALTIDNTYLLDRDHAAQGGVLVYESQTMRSKVNYQFTRALSARVVVEYDSTLANSQQTILQRTKEVASQALITWLPHPGTAVYVGYSNDLQNLDRSLCYKLQDGSCNPYAGSLPRNDTLLNDGKQIFVKVSYLLRF